MARFIRVETEHVGTVRINIDHIVSYSYRYIHANAPTKEAHYGTIVVTTVDQTERSDGYFVKETPEEIDRLINPMRAL